MNKILLGMVGVAALLGSAGASAALITGNIGFGGAITPNTSLDSATSFSFTGVSVNSASGDFDTYTTDLDEYLASPDTLDLSTATFTNFDFTINPFVNIAPLWTAGGFSFTLTSLTLVSQDAAAVVLTGYGLLSGNGFEETDGAFNLTANPNGESSGFVFSAGTSVSVPEPSVIALFALGLVGIGFARRRKAQS